MTSRSTSEAGSVVVLPNVRQEAARLARAAFPDEACAVVLGRPGPVPQLVELHAAPNRASDRRERFELDPAAVVAAEDRARARGLAIVGVWHSHPRGPARPSEADRAAALAWGAGWLSALSAPRAFSCWGLVDGAFRALELVDPSRGPSGPGPRGHRGPRAGAPGSAARSVAP